MESSIEAYSTLVLAISTVILVVITLSVGWAQIKANRNVSGLQILLRLEDKYEGREFLEVRSRLSMQLHSLGVPVPQDAETILDFFETLGHLSRRKLVDQELVQNNFSIPILCYWSALESYIQTRRGRYNDLTIYDQAEWLYHATLKKERTLLLSKDIYDTFFSTEISSTIVLPQVEIATVPKSEEHNRP